MPRQPTTTSSSPNAARSWPRIRAAGHAPSPTTSSRSHHAADLHHRYGEVPNEELEPQAVQVAVAGRMMLKRVMGKACFATLQDGSHGRQRTAASSST